MPNGSFRITYLPLFYLFGGLSILFLFLWIALPGKGIDYRVLLWGNLLLFIVGYISVSMSAKALEHKKVQVFLRLVYGSFLMKFFVLAAGAFTYIALFKKGINKPALFLCFGLYFLYTFVEVRSVMKQRKKSNA